MYKWFVTHQKWYESSFSEYILWIVVFNMKLCTIILIGFALCYAIAEAKRSSGHCNCPECNPQECPVPICPLCIEPNAAPAVAAEESSDKCSCNCCPVYSCAPIPICDENWESSDQDENSSDQNL